MVILLCGYAAFFGSASDIPLLCVIAALWETVFLAFVRPKKFFEENLPFRNVCAFGFTLVMSSLASVFARALPLVLLFALLYGVLYLAGMASDTVYHHMNQPKAFVQYSIIATSGITVFVVNTTTLGLAEQYASIIGIGAIFYAFMAFGWVVGLLALALTFVTHWITVDNRG